MEIFGKQKIVIELFKKDLKDYLKKEKIASKRVKILSEHWKFQLYLFQNLTKKNLIKIKNYNLI